MPSRCEYFRIIPGVLIVKITSKMMGEIERELTRAYRVVIMIMRFFVFIERSSRRYFFSSLSSTKIKKLECRTWRIVS